VETMGLVKTSAIWSWLEIKQTLRAFEATFARTKLKSISTCLVRAWKTGLAEDRLRGYYHTITLVGLGEIRQDNALIFKSTKVQLLCWQGTYIQLPY
jgi:hypothetical protein